MRKEVGRTCVLSRKFGWFFEAFGVFFIYETRVRFNNISFINRCVFYAECKSFYVEVATFAFRNERWSEIYLCFITWYFHIRLRNNPNKTNLHNNDYRFSLNTKHTKLTIIFATKIKIFAPFNFRTKYLIESAEKSLKQNRSKEPKSFIFLWISSSIIWLASIRIPQALMASTALIGSQTPLLTYPISTDCTDNYFFLL